jgi:hypothetical protein
VVTKFVSHLWLTDLQISKLSKAFVSEPIPLVPSVPVAWVAGSLIESLQKLTDENLACEQDPIASLSDSSSLGVLALELAQALAVLEEELRRMDPVGECVRWSARKYTRDFLSFPERVSSISLSSPR